MPKRPFTRSGKAVKEDMLATPPSWREKNTAPDASTMAADSSDGGECKKLTETIQDDEEDFYISSDTLDANRRDEFQTVGKLANLDLLALVLA